MKRAHDLNFWNRCIQTTNAYLPTSSKHTTTAGMFAYTNKCKISFCCFFFWLCGFIHTALCVYISRIRRTNSNTTSILRDICRVFGGFFLSLLLLSDELRTYVYQILALCHRMVRLKIHIHVRSQQISEYIPSCRRRQEDVSLIRLCCQCRQGRRAPGMWCVRRGPAIKTNKRKRVQLSMNF